MDTYGPVGDLLRTNGGLLYKILLNEILSMIPSISATHNIIVDDSLFYNNPNFTIHNLMLAFRAVLYECKYSADVTIMLVCTLRDVQTVEMRYILVISNLKPLFCIKMNTGWPNLQI